MEPFPSLVQVQAADDAPSATVRSVPAATGRPVGEAPTGYRASPFAATGTGDWLAIPWAGETGWLARSDTRPPWLPLAAGGDTGGLAFDWPIGPASARGLAAVPPGWYIAVGFAEAYQTAPGRRAIHTGLDLNLRTGGDSDLGQPVYATADGLVTASSVWPVWGNIVLVQHDLPDGGTLWSQYAHLARRLVRRGQRLARGDQIGTIGKGQGNRYLAHLHFEIRTRDLPASYWPGLNRAAVLAHYADPRAVLAQPAAAVAPGPQAARRAAVAETGTTPDGTPPLQGKGLFVREPWPARPRHIEATGRAWRQLALDFVVLKAAHLDRPYPGDMAAWRAARADGDVPALWGWSTIAGRAPWQEVALAAEAAATLGATGWVVEPLASYPLESVDPVMSALRAALGGAPLAVTWRPEVPLELVCRLAPWADVLMPWVDGAGAVALPVAQIAHLGRPIVPVLCAGATPDAGFVAQVHARGLAGAALATVDGWRAPDETLVTNQLGTEPWPPTLLAPAQPAAEPA